MCFLFLFSTCTGGIPLHPPPTTLPVSCTTSPTTRRGPQANPPRKQNNIPFKPVMKFTKGACYPCDTTSFGPLFCSRPRMDQHRIVATCMWEKEKERGRKSEGDECHDINLKSNPRTPRGFTQFFMMTKNAPPRYPKSIYVFPSSHSPFGCYGAKSCFSTRRDHKTTQSVVELRPLQTRNLLCPRTPDTCDPKFKTNVDWPKSKQTKRDVDRRPFTARNEQLDAANLSKSS